MSTPPSVNPWAWASDAAFSSGPRSGSNTKNTPSGAAIAQGHIAGQPLLIDYQNGLANNVYQWLEWLRLYAGGGWFGDGSDGDVTVNSGGSLSRNMRYNTLTVESGGELDAAGFIIRARRSVTIESGGIIYRIAPDGAIGGVGAGGAGGTASTAKVLGSGGDGGDGGDGVAAGDPGGAETNAIGGRGGDGGDAGGSGGTGGASTAPTAATGDYRALPAFATGHLIGASGLVQAGGGGGGGGGACNDAGGGGGGGGAGNGPVIVLTPELIIEGTGVIRVPGGRGGAGFGTEASGGGGGGGGSIFLGVRFLSDTLANWIAAGNLLATGGLGGAGAGAGAAGDPGEDGDILLLIL